MPDTVPSFAASASPQRRPAWRRWAGAALVLLVLLLVFALYGNPDFMVMMADQMWACF
jgi:hypothetical protein